MDVGARLVRTRTALGLSQSEFAAGANLAVNTYNQYESGKNRPSIDNAILLCEVYGLTLDWIYRGDPSGLKYSLAVALRDLT